MTYEEYLEMLRRHEEEEAKMTPEEREALRQARRRHARKARSEIMASYEIDQRKAEAEKKRKEEEE